jgi:hypothetical protein
MLMLYNSLPGTVRAVNSRRDRMDIYLGWEKQRIAYIVKPLSNADLLMHK